MMGVQHHKKILVAEFAPTFIGLIQALTGEKHSQAANRGIAPLILAHLSALWIQPKHILYIGAFDGTALEKMLPPEYGMPLPQVDHALHKGQQVTIFGLQNPA
jgi:hypothetical protein